MDLYFCSTDAENGKIVKKFRSNPVGEDIHLGSDGLTILKDEDKIIKAQRIFKHNYYKPGGKGYKLLLSSTIFVGGATRAHGES